MKEWTKKLVALLCSVMLLCSLTSVGVSADNGLEIWDGLDTIYRPFAAEFYPYCSALPDGVYEDDLIWTIGDESVVQYIEGDEYLSARYQAIAAGETTLTASTADGVYSDTATLVIQPAIPMNSDGVTVYVNSTYQARTFEYVPQKTGVYMADMDLPANSYGYVTVYDAELNMVASIFSGDMVELTANETYYLYVVAASYYNSMGIAFDMTMTYIGGAETEPTSLVFVEDEITMSVYDTVAFPAYTFEPGGGEWYDSVTFSVEEGSVLTVNPDAYNMYATGVGKATLTATADYYGWTDTVTVNVVDEKRVLTTDATLAMSVGGSDELAVFFTAPETKTYVFYSVTETEQDDPFCLVYDSQTGDEIGYSDDVGSDLNFAVSVELTEGQTVKLSLGGYGYVNNFELGVGDPVAATGVEVFFYQAVSQQGDTVYVMSGTWLYPDARFLGGSTVITEEYDIVISSEDATPDENDIYMLEAGQSATVTVTTASGLTDTVTVVAIDLLGGDITLDGVIDAADALELFYYINGVSTPDAATLGAMDITGDNKITLDDAVRLFYMASGLI